MIAVGTTVLGGCSGDSVPFEPQPVAVPAGIPATGPRISGDADSGLVLSWMEESDNGDSLFFSRLVPDGWSPAASVVGGVNMFVNWADMPSVQSMGGNRLSAHWLEKSGDSTYAYDIVFTQSLDGGGSWSDPIRPHSDDTQTEHGFVSMFADGSGTGLIWLDGRKMVNEGTDDPVASGMTLRSASVDQNSGIHKEQLVDELICDCCQTDVAIASSGPVAVYRDRTINEIRDIWITRRTEGTWQPGNPIADDGWEIPGCPVNGPAVVAVETFVAVAWFTAADDQPVVKLAMSGDNGESFSWQTDVDRGPVFGRVGLTLLPGNRVAVSWLRKGDNDLNELRTKAIGMGGLLGDAHIVATRVGAFSVPQIGVSGPDLVFVWTETDDRVNSIHSAKVPLKAL